MLEYTVDDAEALLMKNEEAAVKSLAQVDDDLGFLRDQTTTIEVSILARQTSCAILNLLYCLSFVLHSFWKWFVD